jgi:hypothetical protein
LQGLISDVVADQTLNAHARLQMFPICVLRHCPRSRSGRHDKNAQHKYTLSLLNTWTQSDDGKRVHANRPGSLGVNSSDPSSIARKNLHKCCKLVQFGRLSDACTILGSSGVLNFTPEDIEALERLHPPARPSENLYPLFTMGNPLTATPGLVHKNLVRKQISTFRKGTACGRDGCVPSI